MPSTFHRVGQRLTAMPPHVLGGIYVGVLTVTALLQHFVPGLWPLLIAIEAIAFLALFVVAAFLRLDEDALMAGFLLAFSVGVGILVSRALVGIVATRSVGGVALAVPPLVFHLVLRAIVVVPLLGALVWLARRVARVGRPSQRRPVSHTRPR